MDPHRRRGFQDKASRAALWMEDPSDFIQGTHYGSWATVQKVPYQGSREAPSQATREEEAGEGRVLLQKVAGMPWVPYALHAGIREGMVPRQRADWQARA